MHRAAVIVSIVTSTAAAQLGALTPPPGPITDTGPDLSDISTQIDRAEPRTPLSASTTPGNAGSVFTIVNPGSYYLTADLSLFGINGIEIAAEDVTIDLNGFTIFGDNARVKGITNDGAANASNIEIRNGAINGCDDAGIDLTQSGTSRFVVRDVRVINGGSGIRVGPDSRVLGCLADSNSSVGISVRDRSRVIDCIANNNGSSGVSTSREAFVSGCSATANGGSGIGTLEDSVVENCFVHESGSNGISVSFGSVVRDSTANESTFIGISTSTSCSVIRCTAKSNASNGIVVGNSSTVTDCVASVNSRHGIEAFADSYIARNHCDSNGTDVSFTGAGIFISGSDNRIEANSVADGENGIQLNGTGNLIIRNSVARTTSTEYIIPAANRYGRIVDLRSSATVAVSGASATSTLTTSDPWANFAY
ncbi:MAG: right-handed parallel beta-helix repeat-containing protein [Planctomycetota bacterium]